MTLIFALSCCFCTAINDLVFRLYARKSRSRGAYVLIIGLVWTSTFLLFLKLDFACWQTTLFWGIVSGLFSVVANILLIEGMSHNDAGICSTIYRLNLVFVALGAFILLGETVTFMKLLGISFAIIAIFMFFLDTPHGGHTNKAKLGFYLVGIAALLRAGMGLSYKYAFMEGADRNSLLVINGILWIVGGAVYTIYRETFRREIWQKKLEIWCSLRFIDLRNRAFYGFSIAAWRCGSGIAFGADEFYRYLRTWNIIFKGKIKSKEGLRYYGWNPMHTMYEYCYLI